MTEAPPVILICTVGGSSGPVRSAIDASRPVRVCFVVSDGANGPSSRAEVEGEGGLEAHARVQGCTQVEFVAVPTDDPDRALALLVGRLRQLQERNPGHRILADYTGGTKSMSGALLMAALSRSGVEVQVMAGKRPDLAQVEAGTEKRHPILSDFVVADRQLALAGSLVQRSDYPAALAILEELQARLDRAPGFRPPPDWRKRVAAALRACQVMASWDAFRHQEAWRLLDQALNDGMPFIEDIFEDAHVEALRGLGAQVRDEPSWRLCADLQRNAERLAGRGRFDDALARLYRLAEAAVQARLFTRWGLKSGKIPSSAVPEGFRRDEAMRRDNRTGEPFLELGLMRALELIEIKDPRDALVAAWDRRDDGRLVSPTWQAGRNKSILAHGYRSVDETAWKQASQWVDRQLARFWEAEAVPHLPTKLPI